MKHLIGIDIGTLYTKVVEIEIASKIFIKSRFLIPTPLLSGVQETTLDKNALAQEILRKIPLSRFKEPKTKIGINIPFFSPVITTIVLPRMNRKELEIAAMTEARRKMIPAPGPKSVFETVFLGETIEANIPRYEVLVVREEKDFVELALNLFKEAELTPHLIAPVCASMGALLVRKPEYKNKEVAFIDIVYTSMNISISRGQHIIFNRSIFFGCRDIIQGVANGLGVSPQKAEDIILKEGIPDVEFDPKNRVAIAEEIMRQKYEASMNGKASAETNPLELRMFMEPFLERIVQEIRRTFIYFKERYEARNIEEIFFVGGGSLIKNIVSLVGKRISPFPKLIEIDKFLNISFPQREENKEFPLFLGAIGTALATTLKPQEVINFLPFELKRKEELAIKRSIFSAVCMFISCGLFLGWLNFWIIGMSVKRELKRVNFKIERLEGVHTEEKSLSDKRKLLENRIAAIQELIEKRKNPLPLLYALDIRKTDKMFFSYLYVGGKKDKKTSSQQPSFSFLKDESTKSSYILKLKVKIWGDYESAYKVIKEITADLRGINILRNIKVIPPKLDKITPQVTGDSVQLTNMGWQEFILDADLKM